jgi:molybdopterin molybdotransferase
MPGPTQIYDSISYGLAGFIAAWGGEPQTSAPLKDSTALIQSQVEAALATSDLVVIVGGASVGDYDLARGALANLGAEELFAKVAVRPGKPTWLARARGTLVLGLPGNPASAMVCARLFLRPMLDVMLGRDPALSLRKNNARLNAPLKANGARENYLRARTEIDSSGQLIVTALNDQDSSLTTIFAAANALLARPPRGEALDAGALVPVLPL